MKHFMFVHDAEEAAKDFANTPGVHLNMIPRDLGANVKFWAKLVELSPELIGRVPQKVIETKEFADSIDHIRFFNFIPTEYLTGEERSEYLTDEDGSKYKKIPEKAIWVLKNPVQVNTMNEYSWYCVNDENDWRSASSLDTYMLFALIEEHRRADQINPELWTQELADYLMTTGKALVSFDDIPEQFVRDEWREIMTLYKNKRYPIFGDYKSISEPERIPEYWGSFKTEKEIMLALDLEELINRCQNPWGYAVSVGFDFSDDHTDYSKIFADLWDAISETVSNNETILKRMMKLYAMFSRCIPKELFKPEWLEEHEEFQAYKRSCRNANLLVKCAKNEVKRLERVERLKEERESFKAFILEYLSMTDEEVERFISEII